MFYNPTTHEKIRSGKEIGVLGLNADNCEDHGFVTYTVAPRPEVKRPQVATLADLPTEDRGAWARRWAITTEEPTEADVNAERERRLVVGASFTVPGVTDPIPLQGRPFDQTVYLALLTRASGYKTILMQNPEAILPALTLRAADDVIYELTPDQMISLISQAMTWFENVMATSWAMKDGTAPFEAGIPSDFTSDTHWP